jgi:hypothetical protein
MPESKEVAAPTNGPSRWTTVFVTVACTLIPLFVAGSVAWGRLQEQLSAQGNEIVALQAADVRFVAMLDGKINRDEMREFVSQLNQRLVDLRADFRVYYGRRSP